jgi:hypothetical protein
MSRTSPFKLKKLMKDLYLISHEFDAETYNGQTWRSL